jgi:histone-lysine N-methyltransferase SETD2
MKVQIRDQLRQIAFPEMTSLNTPEVIAKTKGAKKRGRDPSFWEHVDAQFPDSQASQTKPSLSKQKGARIGKTTPTPNPPKEILHIDQMPLFMHSYIDDIIDVEGDGYCGYRVVALDQNKSEDDYNLIRLVMLRELNLNRERYLRLYGSKRRLNYIIDAMYPPPKINSRNKVAPKEKWLTFPDMGHIIATHYNKVVVQLTKHTIGISETFFPLRGSPPIDRFPNFQLYRKTFSEISTISENKIQNNSGKHFYCAVWKIFSEFLIFVIKDNISSSKTKHPKTLDYPKQNIQKH